MHISPDDHLLSKEPGDDILVGIPFLVAHFAQTTNSDLKFIVEKNAACSDIPGIICRNHSAHGKKDKNSIFDGKTDYNSFFRKWVANEWS